MQHQEMIEPRTYREMSKVCSSSKKIANRIKIRRKKDDKTRQCKRIFDGPVGQEQGRENG